MIRRSLLLVVGLACAPLASSVSAQVRLPVQPPYRTLGPAKSHEDSQPIPPAYRPPPGMCRIWLDNVPASQQPATTDCVSAVRNRPNNGRVIFGDDYVEKRGKKDKDRDKDRDRDRKPDGHAEASIPTTGDLDGLNGLNGLDRLEDAGGLRGTVALASAARVHGPMVDETQDTDAWLPEEPGVVAWESQPPARRQPPSPATRRAQARDSIRRDAARGAAPGRPAPRPPVGQPARPATPGRETTAGRDPMWQEPDLRDRRAGSLSEQRRALRERGRPDARRDRDRDDRYDRDDDYWDDDRRGRDPRDRRDPRDGRYGAYGVPGGGVYGVPNGVPYGGVYGNGYGTGYGPVYGNGYGLGLLPAPGRANGTCLDRDGDGWCDDSRTGGGYCLDRDNDGRCDDYPDVASAPYSSSMPPMSAAVEVERGAGSQAALRWLGTAEVIVRTSELKRTGTPYRAMWLDASTQRLLQVWTDRDGDGVVDRIEIYRNGQVAKIIGR